MNKKKTLPNKLEVDSSPVEGYLPKPYGTHYA